jgi:hypothetical protein
MSLETHSKPSDRRTEPRRPASGQVKLRPEGFATTSVPGQMMDVNSGGFRARHSFQTLVSGHIVDFVYGSLEGRARVVWTRIVSDHVESGFLILPRAQG